MATIARITTWSSGQVLTASALNAEFNNLVNYLNNADSGSTSWTTVVVTNSSSVPLVVNNSTGTNNIANFQSNGTTVLGLGVGGNATFTNSAGTGNAVQIQSATADTHLYISSVTPRVTLGNNSVYSSRTFGCRMGLVSNTNDFVSGTAAGDCFIFTEGVNGGTAGRLILGSNTLLQKIIYPSGIISTPSQSGCRVYRNTNQSVNDSTTTVVLFDTATFDIQSEFDIATNHKFTAKQAGSYLVTASVTWSTFSAGSTTSAVAIRKNGAVVSTSSPDFGDQGTNGVSTLKIVDVVSLAISDTIDFVVSQNSGSAQTISGGPTKVWATITKVA